MKSYEELTFADDFMFCKVLTTDLNLCKELIELILGIKVKELVLADAQKAISPTYDGKGVRFDVYVEDKDNTVYDIEMQTTKQKDLAKRTRYYQGMIDLNLIEKGERYGKLKNTFIIFICLEDPFGRNLPVYTFQNICKQDNTLLLNDETTKVIINASGERYGLSADMAAFLDFIEDHSTNSSFTKKLDNAVTTAIDRKEWRLEYMTMNMKLMERYDEGILEGSIKERILMLKEMNIPNNDIITNIAKRFNLTMDEAEEKFEKYKK